MAVPSKRKLELIEAPTPLGLRPPSPGKIPGARLMPRALIEAGLLEGLSVVAHTVLPEPPYSQDPDPLTGTRNHQELVQFMGRLDAIVTSCLREGRFPVIIGGDCSVLLGPAVALKRLGRFALVHFDGHNDFGHERNWGKPYASIAGADLAVVTGRGPRALDDMGGLRPYFLDEDVIQLGEKADPSDEDYAFKDFPLTAIRRLPLSTVRRIGLTATLENVDRILGAIPAEGFWLHIDVDVMDSAVMPAVDSPENGGLSWEEFSETLSWLFRNPRLIGLNIGIYDPDLDPTGACATRIVETLHHMLKEA